jgi:hypothetical protein
VLETLVTDVSQLIPLAGALAITGLALGVGRGLGNAQCSVLFTNVRLLPCYANAMAQQIGAASDSVASSVRPNGGVGVGSSPPVYMRSGPLDRLRGGFDRIVDRDQASEEPSDSPLLVQIGMVLGLAYLALLSIWFSATRLRWTPRDPI